MSVPMQNALFKHLKGDKVIWMIIICLSVLSLLAVYSSTGMLAYSKRGGNTLYYLIKQTAFIGVGFVITYFVHRFPYRVYFGAASYIFGLSVVLLFLTLAMGVARNDASRWLMIPVIGISFQTSDFAKIALIILVSKILSMHQNDKDGLKSAFYKATIAIGIACGLILPANFSTAFLVFGVCFIMLFVGRVDKHLLIKMVIVAITALTFFVLIMFSFPEKGRVGTWQKRITSFFDNKSESNFQAEQSKIAIATGGFLGKGAGNSTQRNILPHPYSDFIYAIIVEEYGAVGGIVIAAFYIFLLFRAIKIIKQCNRTFPALLVIGLTLSMVFQALINMGVAVNIFPVTGQPLPLVSWGGTSILFTSISLGIILNVSRQQTIVNDIVEKQDDEFEFKQYPFIMG